MYYIQHKFIVAQLGHVTSKSHGSIICTQVKTAGLDKCAKMGAPTSLMHDAHYAGMLVLNLQKRAINPISNRNFACSTTCTVVTSPHRAVTPHLRYLKHACIIQKEKNNNAAEGYFPIRGCMCNIAYV